MVNYHVCGNTTYILSDNFNLFGHHSGPFLAGRIDKIPLSCECTLKVKKNNKKQDLGI